MHLSTDIIRSWASPETLAAAVRLQKSGAVQGVQSQGNLMAGSIKAGASRLVVRLRITDGQKPKIKCECKTAKEGGICIHAVATALQWLSAHAEAANPETVTFEGERAPTLKEIERWAGKPVFLRAEQIFRSGRVRDPKFSYPTGSASVLLPNGGRLPVTFKMLPGGMAEGHCNCYVSRDRGEMCEHITAAAIAVSVIYNSDAMQKQRNAERAHMAQMAKAKDLIKSDIRGRPAILRVVIPRNLPKFFLDGKVPAVPMLFVEGRPLRPSERPDGPLALSEADSNLIGMLEDIAGGALPDTLSLSQSDTVALLRCARHSWIGYGDKTKLEVDDCPLVTPYRVSADPKNDALRLRLETPKNGILLADGNQGFWLCGNRVTPVSPLLPEPVRYLYSEPNIIRRNHFTTFLNTELPRLAKILPAANGSLTADDFTTTPATPHFILHLQGSTVSVTAKLIANYNGQHVFAGCSGTISLPDPDDFFHCLVQNPAAEKAALERTHRAGFPGIRGDDLGAVIGTGAILNLLGGQLPALRRDGWDIHTEGTITDLLTTAKRLIPIVTATPDTNDTFNLTITYETPDGHPAPVPRLDIDRAIHAGNAFIETPTGPLLIDITSLRTLKETVEACHANRSPTPGARRIHAVNAPFLQKALEELDGIRFTAPPHWRQQAARQNRSEAPRPVPLGPLENTLRPYQKDGVYWLRFLETCGFCGILADEMGLGKTLQTLTWLSLPRCRETARNTPALIICPTSLVENWNREAAKFTPGMKRLVLSGPNRSTKFNQIKDADLVITSYALIRRDAETHSAQTYSAIVLDEAQAIKNRTTQNALAVKRLHADTRLVLSGTPIENSVADLWSIMGFLMPGYLGTYDDFKLRYEDPIAEGDQIADAAQRRLRAKLHPFLLRRIKKDVAKDLPDKIRSVTYCTLTPDQRRLYEETRQQVRDKMRGLVKEKGFQKSKFEVLALLMRLRQICCDLRLLRNRTPKPGEAPSAKLEALSELLEDTQAGGHRLLVFSQFTSMLRLIANHLDTQHTPYLYIDGSTKNRVELCAKFNTTPTIPVFLISLKAGGTGLNLTGADTVVHFDPWWNPAAEDQATDRAHRIGQKKTVQAIKFIAEDTIEEKVLELQRKKQTLIDATVNTTDASLIGSLTMAEIESLLE